MKLPQVGITLSLLLIMAFGQATAQTQVVKGVIKDAQADYELIGATIILVGSEPVIGATTDIKGNFRLENVPIGRQAFVVQYIGYKTVTLSNVLVTAGKEVYLDIKLEESVEALKELVITADDDKDLPINELAKVSARTFSLEEVTRFSGGRNDVARLASNFAGVSTANDSRNDIVVRGNSPTGLLWRIEGIPIATTNHFNTLGTTGGPVSALNTNLLRTSDFITGAFPAEYGNASAAVFDVNLRNGNTDKAEFTAQMSAFSGLEFMAEGPIDKEKRSSFVASYRYGIASVAATGTSAIPYYQDFSFKLNFGDGKLGQFELFGLGGLSSIDFLGDEIDETDLFANPNEDAYVSSGLGLVGLSHKVRLSKTAYLKTTLAASTNFNTYDQDNIIKGGSGEVLDKYRAVESFTSENRYTLSSVLNKKFNARFSLRTGILAEVFDLNLDTKDRDNRANIPDDNGDGIPDYFIPVRDVTELTPLLQAYAQGEYKLSDELSFTFGLHGQYLELTENLAIEPRAALSWQFTNTQRLSVAYGYHSQMAPLPILFHKEETSSGVFEATNLDLDFMRSHHFIVSYDQKIGSNWRVKAEAYYQALRQIPVESVASSYSVINEGADFVFGERGSLVNEGTGVNYGVELTVERFFSKGFYGLLTTSLFESTYKGSDGIERSTAFNNNYVANVLFGKEFKVGQGKRNAITFDTKLATSGGARYTPIDLAATRANAGREVLFEEQAFSQQYDAYFRWDVKFGFRLNGKKKKVSHQFFIDLQNVTNRENIFVRRYNEVTDQINDVSQIGFFPDVLYRFQF
ncbi:MAG: TonB-dependent receptor [Flammeovirgaceae bacterium]